MSEPMPPSQSGPISNAGATNLNAGVAVKSYHPARGINYLFALITLVGGAILGFLLASSSPFGMPTATMPQEKSQSSEVTLPSDAVQIQSCANNKGTLYVKPNDIPVGPVYMVSDGRIIGIEFMLAKDDFLGGKSYKYLQGLGMKIDHVNVGLLSQGHEGYAVPHYHVDVYNVSREIEKAIVCQTATTPSVATGSANQNTASGSGIPLATPSSSATKSAGTQ